jgi:hypothetical protein
MPDLETRLPDLLRELSSDMPVAVRDMRPTLRRAKRRRLATTIVSSAVVVALVVGTAAGIRVMTVAERHVVGQTETPEPKSTFRGFWPETSWNEADLAQHEVDDGSDQWRTDPRKTAERLTTTLFGWAPDEVIPDRTTVLDGYALVVVANRLFGDDVPPITIELDQLGRRGPDGIWSVVDVSSTLFDGPIAVRATDAAIEVSGAIKKVFDASTIHVDLMRGATVLAPQATAVVQLGQLDHGRFSGISIPTSGIETEAGVLWVRVVEATGKTLDAAAVPMTDLVDGSYPASNSVLPAAVASTEDALRIAIGGYDFRTLQGLMDPNTFSYADSFGGDDGSDPIPAWRQDPTVLDPILRVLALPPTEPKDIEGYGTFYVWPYLVDADFATLSPDEVDDLHRLGFDDAAIAEMVRQGRYTGPRLSIDSTGVWRSYTVGGVNESA